MVVFPNAKINIGLNILRKRPDNYHNIQSIFYPVELHDILEVVVDNKINNFNFVNTGLKIDAPEEKNLVVKVFKIFKKEYNLPSVKIHLHKVIPFGAGLGGGSSDAAFMIKLLNNLFNLDLSVEKMKEYTKTIGADCSFFIENKPAYVTGIGDKIELIDFSLQDYKIIIKKPNINLNTTKIFSLITPKENVTNLKTLINSPINEWENNITNDFEAVIFDRHKEIKELKEKFYEKGALYASMTGSGSCVFGIFDK
ncbi:MAG: 4-(cytidine 5'-diphospho)-2-C-methyl-D-erythritol kinase [Bacteroidota bacterium]|nr:4-(cytidine 5'-diphospho)-2-C-methyl-D-erythritol kinase [Bacteroidota bacterium]